jgi:hypothetical protein
MRQLLILAFFGCLLSGCGGTGPATVPQVKKAIAAPPADQSRRFPSAGQVSMKLMPEKMLGRDFLPGGNLAEYQWKRGATYRQFLVKAANAQAAAIMLLDFKNSLTDTKYLAHMGGYFGQDHGTPVYVFAKGPWLTGFYGLPEKDADVLARQFAVRLD